jgi:hypothetical protein
VGLFLVKVAIDKLRMCKALPVGVLLHRRGLDHKLRRLDRLLDIDLQNFDRVGHRDRMDKTPLGLLDIESRIVQLNKKAWYWQIEREGVIRVSWEHLVGAEKELIFLRDYPSSNDFSLFGNREGQPGGESLPGG